VGEQGGLISRPGADLEYLLVASKLEKLEVSRVDGRL
jgi:hypothetical protein